MQDGNKILSVEKGRPEVKKAPETTEGRDMAEVKEAQQSVSEGLNILGGNTETLPSGEVSEDEKKAKGVYSGAVTSAGRGVGEITVVELPKIEVMIEQTMLAIENELKEKQAEVNVLMKKNASPYEVNDLVRKIRFLNSLLYRLKRAAKLAEEYVVALWKQFVGKA
jgi:hypothetical protein